MQQIIIFEGHDMVGKTTILKALSEKISIPVFKETRQERWYDHVIDLLYAEEARCQMLEQVGCSIIFDRSYPSEWVYSQVYNRPTLPEKLAMFDKRYAKMGAKIIILYKNPDEFLDDDQALIEKEKYIKIKEKYEDFAKQSECQCLLLDTSDQNLEKQISLITRFLQGGTYE
jgi:thymidylate kinase